MMILDSGVTFWATLYIGKTSDWFGVAVTVFVTSTKLCYVELG